MGLGNDSFLAVQSRVTCFQNGEIKKQEKELQSLRNDVNKHASEYDSNYSGGDSFQAACDVGKEIFKEELALMKAGKTLAQSVTYDVVWFA